MRWYKREKVRKQKESGTVRKFLLIPKTIKGETRWLCMAKWYRRYVPFKIEATGGYDIFGNKAFYMNGDFYVDERWED